MVRERWPMGPDGLPFALTELRATLADDAGVAAAEVVKVRCGQDYVNHETDMAWLRAVARLCPNVRVLEVPSRGDVDERMLAETLDFFPNLESVGEALLLPATADAEIKRRVRQSRLRCIDVRARDGVESPLLLAIMPQLDALSVRELIEIGPAFAAQLAASDRLRRLKLEVDLMDCADMRRLCGALPSMTALQKLTLAFNYNNLDERLFEILWGALRESCVTELAFRAHLSNFGTTPGVRKFARDITATFDQIKHTRITHLDLQGVVFSSEQLDHITHVIRDNYTLVVIVFSSISPTHQHIINEIMERNASSSYLLK